MTVAVTDQLSVEPLNNERDQLVRFNPSDTLSMMYQNLNSARLENQPQNVMILMHSVLSPITHRVVKLNGQV